jgi:hypothetical protein
MKVWRFLRMALIVVLALGHASSQAITAKPFPFVVTKSLSVPKNPHGIAFSGDGRWLLDHLRHAVALAQLFSLAALPDR